MWAGILKLGLGLIDTIWRSKEERKRELQKRFVNFVSGFDESAVKVANLRQEYQDMLKELEKEAEKKA